VVGPHEATENASPPTSKRLWTMESERSMATSHSLLAGRHLYRRISPAQTGPYFVGRYERHAGK
jgi:hypothetical protein